MNATDKTVAICMNPKGQILDCATGKVLESTTPGGWKIPAPPAGFRAEVKVVFVSAERAAYLLGGAR